jgi:hypothetical protein
MYLSIGYIQRVCIGPQMNNSSTKWMGKCGIMFMNVGGNRFSNKQTVIVLSAISASLFASTTFRVYSLWNIRLILNNACLTFSSRTCLTTIGNICNTECKCQFCNEDKSFLPLLTKIGDNRHWTSILRYCSRLVYAFYSNINKRISLPRLLWSEPTTCKLIDIIACFTVTTVQRTHWFIFFPSLARECLQYIASLPLADDVSSTSHNQWTTSSSVELQGNVELWSSCCLSLVPICPRHLHNVPTPNQNMYQKISHFILAIKHWGYIVLTCWRSTWLHETSCTAISHLPKTLQCCYWKRK